MAGINRALYENRHLAKANKPCIFLSHISVDKSSATAIGTYITKHGDIDIYLDVDDSDLQNAVSRGDPANIDQVQPQRLYRYRSLKEFERELEALVDIYGQEYRLPDQSAKISFSNKTVRLVISTSGSNT